MNGQFKIKNLTKKGYPFIYIYYWLGMSYLMDIRQVNQIQSKL